MSAAKTGTPAFDSWPARSWRVLVLPVPVAPAMSPWRFSMDSGDLDPLVVEQLAVVHGAADDERRFDRTRSPAVIASRNAWSMRVLIPPDRRGRAGERQG